MSNDKKRGRRQSDYGLRWEIVSALRDTQKNLSEIIAHFDSYLGLLGVFGSNRRRKQQSHWLRTYLKKQLDELVNDGWIICQDEYYTLTTLGSENAKHLINDVRRTHRSILRVLQPEKASIVSMIIHFGLAASKIPAAVLSGSIGLLNDSIDTMLDGLSSLLVHFGFRFEKVRTVNILLILLMIATGSFAFFEAIRRFFIPIEPTVDIFTFTATIISAFVCMGLWFYQRYIGLRFGSLIFITQSVDSRNHVIVAASVMAGLISSYLNFPLMDTVVGLFVAILILKSAVELAIEMAQSLRADDVDLSRYAFKCVKRLERFRRAQFRDRLIALVNKKEIATRSELVALANHILRVNRNALLNELGLSQQEEYDTLCEAVIQEIFENGWLEGEEELTLTNTGKEYIRELTYISR